MLWLDLKKESEKITMSDNSSKNNGLCIIFGVSFVWFTTHFDTK